VRFTVIVGNPRPASRTLAVATAAADAITRSIGLSPGYELVDLSALSRRLLLPEPSAAVEDAVAAVLGADLLLVASPTFKATYTGLLKVFLDRLPYRGLDGTHALPLLVMNSPEHRLAVDLHLRPLLVELGATVPTPALAVLESDLVRLDDVVRPWAAQVTEVLGLAAAAAATVAQPA
jgi:FMN reductase